MLWLYLASLYWLIRRRGGVERRIDFVLLTGLFCNLPLIILLLTLVNRKMALSEALGFIATFLIIGSAFGLGFTLATDERRGRGIVYSYSTFHNLPSQNLHDYTD